MSYYGQAQNDAKTLDLLEQILETLAIIAENTKPPEPWKPTWTLEDDTRGDHA